MGEVISQVQTQILIKFIFRIFTKHQLQNAEQFPTSKSCLYFNFKILTNL